MARCFVFTLARGGRHRTHFRFRARQPGVAFNLNDTLKEGGRDSGAGARGKRLRSALVIAEVAVSFILLIGAGLLINSFLHLRNLDPGFRADHLLALNVDLVGSEVSGQRAPDRVFR